MDPTDAIMPHLVSGAPWSTAYNTILSDRAQYNAVPQLDAEAFRGTYVDWGNKTLYRDDEMSVPVYYRTQSGVVMQSKEP